MKSPTIEKSSGVYYLQGVKETASGFKLNPDGSFQFFFTYGALDRYGSGTWTIENGVAILQSRPWPGRDFEFASSNRDGSGQVSVRIVGGNPQLYPHVYVSLKKGETGSWLQTDKNGEARFGLEPVSSVSMVFEFAPERFTRFIPDDPSHNQFAFTFESWMMEVFFNRFPLKIEKYALVGKHPLLKGESYVFEKG